jgi:signal transduction histidine kinase/CheY-like chemotaxis protein
VVAKVKAQRGEPSAFSGWDRLRQPIWLFDPETSRGVYANASALRLWGARSQEELLGRDFSKLSPAVRTRTRRLAEVTAGGACIHERWTFYPNGQPVTVQALISTYTLEDGRPVLLFEASPVDVEDGERRAVEALRHTSSIITHFDEEGRVVFSNPAAVAAYGEGLGFVGRFLDPERGRALLKTVAEGGVIAELLQVKTLEGERSHHLDARSILDPVTGRTGVLVSERDVTAQVKAERALVMAEERAEVAAAKERFLANMSHELRTPLTAILGYADLLSRSDISDTARSHAGRIARSGQTLLGLVNDVIAVSELGRGAVRLEPEPFSPEDLLITALSAIQGEAEAKGLELNLYQGAAVPVRLIGDSRRLLDILGHFLSNAIKFTDKGEITAGVDLCEAPRADLTDHAAIELWVADTGRGVPEANRLSLFEPFNQVDDSRRRGVKGGGLGLAIVKALSDLMGGDVGVESVLGAGSKFWVRLTLPIDASKPKAVEPPPADQSLHILYADDHENNRILVQTLLESQGHSCDLVEDGAQALRAAASSAYDLILMDIQMPVMDGVTATRAIRQHEGVRKTLPILALTANTQSTELEIYADAGMNDVVAKPVNMADLFAKVRSWGSFAEERPREIAV